MTDHELNERRGYFRVEDKVLLEVAHVPTGQVAALREWLASPLPSAFKLSSQLNELRQANLVLKRRLETESSSVMRYLSLLDQKIDKIAEVLLLGEMPHATLQSVDLGADGMGFDSRSGFPPGAVLDIKLGLLSSGHGLRCLGEVMQSRANAAGSHRVGVRFEYVNPADQELLVQHVLHRQSALLRARHES